MTFADVRAMLRIAAPLALAELGWMAMAVVDTIMVGKLPGSAIAIGAASLGSALFYPFAIFGMGLLSGLDTVVSQAFGANDRTKGHRALASGFAICLCAAPVLMAAVWLAIPFLAWIGVNPAVLPDSVAFLHRIVWSLPFLLVYTTLRRYLQGIHAVKPIAFALISSNVVNAAGNWLLIFGHWGAPAMGVRGSAVSTVIARFYLAAVLWIAVRRHDPKALHDLRADAAEAVRLLRLGLPAAAAIGLEVGVFHLVTVLAGKLDPTSLAAHTIALNAAAVTYVVALGIGSAAAVSVGREIGARNPAGAGRAGWIAIWIGVAYESVTAAIFVLAPGPLAAIYSADVEIVRRTATLFVIAAVFQIFDGLQTIATGALRGLGLTRAPMVWNLLGYWAFGLPLGAWLCFSLGWGVAGLWDGLCASLALIGIGLTVEWRSRSHQQQIV